MLGKSFFHNCCSWRHRFRILNLHKDAGISTTSVNSLALKVELDNTMDQKLASNELKHRKHFGVNKSIIEKVPLRIQSAMTKAVGDYPMKTLTASGEVFDRYLKARKSPMEDSNKKLKMKEIEELVLSDPAKFKLPNMPSNKEDEMAEKLFRSRKNQKVKEIFQQRVYSWQPINYDQHKSLLYLIGRSAQEYAVIMRILREIQRRDSEFTPRSFFDFGSGVGTGTWAVSELWASSIYEYYMVDSSRSMNDLSDLLLREGDVNKEMFLRNVYHRQFLPSRDDNFDIVLSAYSFFELPNLKSRLEIANSLWNKTGKYLIFIENGTNAGFSLLSEIRDFLLQLKSANQQDAFVFSPCPHESPCPRYQLNDGTPCNFECRYETLPFSGPLTLKKELYSYLVIKKGQPSESDRWPRLVRPTMQRHKHIICRMCTQNGKFEDGIFTVAKHGKNAYKCAKHSDWGDQFPAKIVHNSGEPSEVE